VDRMEAGVMYVDAPEKPRLDDGIRRRISMLLRQTYEDQLHEELPPKLATKLDRLRPPSYPSWPGLFARELARELDELLAAAGKRG
jgi:hypothetical protein